MAYLTTLLSYWKPLDEMNQRAAQKVANGSQDDHSDTKEVVLEYSLNSQVVRVNPSVKFKTQQQQ